MTVMSLRSQVLVSMRLSPLNKECLTDTDGDGYAAGVQNSLYEANVNSGDCFDITIADNYSDGCGAFC